MKLQWKYVLRIYQDVSDNMIFKDFLKSISFGFYLSTFKTVNRNIENKQQLLQLTELSLKKEETNGKTVTGKTQGEREVPVIEVVVGLVVAGGAYWRGVGYRGHRCLRPDRGTISDQQGPVMCVCVCVMFSFQYSFHED